MSRSEQPAAGQRVRRGRSGRGCARQAPAAPSSPSPSRVGPPASATGWVAASRWRVSARGGRSQTCLSGPLQPAPESRGPPAPGPRAHRARASRTARRAQAGRQYERLPRELSSRSRVFPLERTTTHACGFPRTASPRNAQGFGAHTPRHLAGTALPQSEPRERSDPSGVFARWASAQRMPILRKQTEAGGGRGSNPRPPGPQPGALPTELPPPRGGQDSASNCGILTPRRPRSSVDRAAGFEPACGGSIPPGATLPAQAHGQSPCARQDP